MNRFNSSIRIKLFNDWSSDTIYANSPSSKIPSELQNRYIQIFPRGKHVIVLWGLVTHELLSSSAADKGLDSRRRTESAWNGLGRLNRLSRGSRGRLPASRHGGGSSTPTPPYQRQRPKLRDKEPPR